MPKNESAPAPRTFPRGFKSAEAAAKVRQAEKAIEATYPNMTAEDAHAYLMEVGAGRYLALANYAPKDRAESAPAPRAKKVKPPLAKRAKRAAKKVAAKVESAVKAA